MSYENQQQKKYQTIYLHLSDGREIAATVKEFCKEGDKLFLHPQFKVTEPKELPKDCYWRKFENKKRT